MGKLVSLGEPFSYPKAIERIRKLWRQGDVAWTKHAKVRLEERHLDANDVRWVIQSGHVVEHSRPARDWRYVVEGRTVEGKTIQCVFEIAGSLLTVVTVLRPRRG